MAEISLQQFIEETEEVIEKGLYDEALARGRHVLQHYPKHLPTYRLLGKVMLEAGKDQLAEDMFLRVLSGDPEDFVARVGMGIIYDRRGEINAAIWHMQRAYELNLNNEAIQGELRRLYGRRDGVEPGRVQLTRGALARLYIRGNLLSRAIQELRSLLDDEPNRVDLRVALAEALWRNEQRVQAEEACLQVLDELPYCLKANAILGDIWTRGGRQEGSLHLQRVEALDPENQMIADFMGESSPLQKRTVQIPRFTYRPPEDMAEQPSWMAAADARALIPSEETGLSTPMEARIEIPSWLEEMGEVGEEEGVDEEAVEIPEWAVEEQPSVDFAPGPAGPAEVEEVAEPAVSEASPFGEVPDWLVDAGAVEEGPVSEEVPDWLAEAGVAEDEPLLEGLPDWLAGAEVPEGEPALEELPDWMAGAEMPEEPAAEEIPDWLAGAEMPEEPAAEEIPDWLAETGIAEEEPALEEIPDWLAETRVAEEEPALEEVPDWLAEAGVTEEPAAEELPDWLVGAAVVEEPAPEEIPDWLADAGVAEEEPALEEIPGPLAEPVSLAEPQPETEALPSWMEGEELPDGDEALAWLESLAAGKEEELRAAAEAEGQQRMAEIMGRPRVEPEPAAEEVAVTSPEAEAAPEEVPEFLAEPQPEAEALPSWMEGEELPDGDEALAWLESLAAGREEELRAAAEAEGQQRMAEIMGRPRIEPEPVVEEAEVAPSEEEPVPEEVPEWLAEAAPLEEPVSAAPELAAPEELPDWLREMAPAEALDLPEEPSLEVEPPAELVPDVEALPAADEAFGWVAFEAEEEPEVEAEEELAEIGAFGWTTFGAEEEVGQPVEEAPSAEAVPAAEEEFGWTGFAEPEPAEAEQLPSTVEAAPAETVAPSPATEAAPPAPPVLKIEEAPEGVRVEAPREPRPTPDDADHLREYLRAHPRDYEARLALARALWQGRNYEESIEAYARLVRSKTWAEEVMADMEDRVKERPDDPAVRRLLGDAYMRLGLLEEALRVYRDALDSM